MTFSQENSKPLILTKEAKSPVFSSEDFDRQKTTPVSLVKEKEILFSVACLPTPFITLQASLW